MTLADIDAAADVAGHFGISPDEIRPLPGEIDSNFAICAAGARYVLRVTPPNSPRDELELQNEVMRHLAEQPGRLSTPTPLSTADGRVIVETRPGLVRMLTWVDGEPYADRPLQPDQLHELGAGLADLVRRLEPLRHRAEAREHTWNLGQAAATLALATDLGFDRYRQSILTDVARTYAVELAPRWSELPHQLIHNDANDLNVLLTGDSVSGLIDFGDTVRSARVAELAVAITYAAQSQIDPWTAARHVVEGWQSVLELTRAEREVLLGLVQTRLAISAVVSQQRSESGNPHHQVSTSRVWDLLERLHAADRVAMTAELTDAPAATPTLEERRRNRLGSALSLAYDTPLHIVTGRRAHLFDARGADYLDCVNNVCHVGHSHPTVVDAAAMQWSRLNTNTRYLNEMAVEYADRLVATFPEGLDTVFLVNSGSEANELAIRIARAHTGNADVVVFDSGYHGNTTTLVDISPYKFNGPGGSGPQPWVHVLDTPDPMLARYGGADAASHFVAHAENVLEGVDPALVIAEPLIGCGGQIVPAPGVLAGLADTVRASGGLYVSDEVQVGFGRVGEAFWGFELHDVVPDIVTMGKPAGNGHPLGAVVTTPALAASFDNGMEYFNTFGGNPVAAAVGLAVLDVIEDERLQERALEMGRRLLAGFGAIAATSDRIVDVRGRGLFLGVQLASAAATKAVVEHCRANHVLLSIDGPGHDVVKIKPPLVFDEHDAERLLAAFAAAVDEL